MKRLIMLSMLALSTNIVAQPMSKNVVTFKDPYIKVTVPKGMCAGFTLALMYSDDALVHRKDLFVAAFAVNPRMKQNNYDPRGGISLAQMNIIPVKADDAAEYQIFLFRLDQQTRLPAEILSPEQYLVVNNLEVDTCNTLPITARDDTGNEQSIGFEPLYLTANKNLSQSDLDAMNAYRKFFTITMKAH